jgi:hypothetical protein
LLPYDFAQHANYMGSQFMPGPLWKIANGSGDLVSRLLDVELKSRLLVYILVKVDRMSMAHGLEVLQICPTNFFSSRMPKRSWPSTIEAHWTIQVVFGCC